MRWEYRLYSYIGDSVGVRVRSFVSLFKRQKLGEHCIYVHSEINGEHNDDAPRPAMKPELVRAQLRYWRVLICRVWTWWHTALYKYDYSFDGPREYSCCCGSGLCYTVVSGQDASRYIKASLEHLMMFGCTHRGRNERGQKLIDRNATVVVHFLAAKRCLMLNRWGVIYIYSGRADSFAAIEMIEVCTDCSRGAYI